MLVITAPLKDYLVKNFALAPDASDDDIRSFVGKAITEGRIEVAKISELTQKGMSEKELQTRNLVKDAVRDVLGEKIGGAGSGSQPGGLKTTTPFAKTADVFGGLAGAGGDGATPGDHLGGNIRVKAPSEMYLQEKSTALHARTGQPVLNQRGLPCKNSSEAELALAGAFLKYTAIRQRRENPENLLTEHERGLLGELFSDRHKWCGVERANDDHAPLHTRMSGEWAQKALLNDSSSGGTEIVPEFFDSMLTTFPLLHSELLPKVTQRDVPRGSTVESGSLGNPTVTWGTPSGTGVNLFNTDSLVGDLDTTLYPVQVALEVSEDFMSDTPVNVGNMLMQNIGQSLLKAYDDVIAYGTGSQPTGILQTSISAIVPAGGSAQAIQMKDLENLIVAVSKAYRVPGQNCTFVMNDALYFRTRGIKTGLSGDETRLLGNYAGDYSLLSYPVAISSAIPNTHIAFGSLLRYVWYKRDAMNFRWITGATDSELSRNNKSLLHVRARVGGRVMDTSAFSRITDLLP